MPKHIGIRPIPAVVPQYQRLPPKGPSFYLTCHKYKDQRYYDVQVYPDSPLGLEGVEKYKEQRTIHLNAIRYECPPVVYVYPGAHVIWEWEVEMQERNGGFDEDERSELTA